MNMPTQQSGDPAALSLPDLRTERDAQRKHEDAVSFVRRLAQGRLDLVTAVRQHKADGTGAVS
ncbi:MAG: AmfC protein, partial [Actinobacteria bacterium]|nr:AmfC protein [Actinomycetota bacterium]